MVGHNDVVEHPQVIHHVTVVPLDTIVGQKLLILQAEKQFELFQVEFLSSAAVSAVGGWGRRRCGGGWAALLGEVGAEAAFLGGRRSGGGEVEFGLVAADAFGGGVVGSGGFLGGGEGAEPDADTLVWVPYFCSPFSPWPLPDSSVHVLASTLALLPCCCCCSTHTFLLLLTWFHCHVQTNNVLRSESFCSHFTSFYR